MDGAVEVLVIERIFVVPDAGSWVRDFVAHEPDAIVSRIRLNLIYGRIGPRHDRRLLPNGGTNGVKIEIRRATAHALLLIGDVVIHIALVRMTLAPNVFVRDYVLRFSKIHRSRVQRRVQVVNVYQNSVRRYVMTVAGVIVGC